MSISKKIKYRWLLLKMYYNLWFRSKKNRNQQPYIYERKKDK